MWEGWGLRRCSYIFCLTAVIGFVLFACVCCFDWSDHQLSSFRCKPSSLDSTCLHQCRFLRPPKCWLLNFLSQVRVNRPLRDPNTSFLPSVVKTPRTIFLISSLKNAAEQWLHCNLTPDIIWFGPFLTESRCNSPCLEKKKKARNSSPDLELPLHFLKSKPYKLARWPTSSERQTDSVQGSSAKLSDSWTSGKVWLISFLLSVFCVLVFYGHWERD